MKKIGGWYYQISFTTKIDGKEEEVTLADLKSNIKNLREISVRRSLINVGGIYHLTGRNTKNFTEI